MNTTTPRPTPGDKVKEIGWAYPGSSEAKLFGYSKTGCYILSEGAWPEPLKAVAGCGHTSPLLVMGEWLDGEWSPHSMV